jgi:hypothetical protein
MELKVRRHAKDSYGAATTWNETEFERWLYGSGEIEIEFKTNSRPRWPSRIDSL